MDRISRDILERIAGDLKLPVNDPRVLQTAYRLLWEIATGAPAEKAERVPNPLLPAKDDPAIRQPDSQDLTDLVNSIMDDPKPRTESLARPLAAPKPNESTGFWLKGLMTDIKQEPANSPKRISAQEWVPAPSPALAGLVAESLGNPGVEIGPAPVASEEAPFSPERDRRAAQAEAAVHGRRIPRFASRNPGERPEDALELTPQQAAKLAPAWLVAGAAHLVIAVILMNIIYFTNYSKPSGVFRVTLRQPSLPRNTEKGKVEGTQDRGINGKENETSAAPGHIDMNDPDKTGELSMPEIGEPTPTVGVAGLPLTTGNGTSGAMGFGGMFAGRGGKARLEWAKKNGGDETTEAAVELGLKWLSCHQNEDGSWGGAAMGSSCTRHKGNHCSPQVGDAPLGNTGIVLLAFAAAGYTQRPTNDNLYDAGVRKGVDYVLSRQRADGRFEEVTIDADYSHAIASLAILELYAMTGDARLKAPCAKAVDYIEAAQQSCGGWDYRAARSNRGDTSVSGWMIMALRAARAAGFPVKSAVMSRSRAFYRDVIDEGRSWVFYEVLNGQKQGGSLAMIATAVYARHNLETAAGPIDGTFARMIANNLPKLTGPWLPEDRDWGRGIYFAYQAGQALINLGGQTWTDWNRWMKKELPALQRKDDDCPGSWLPWGEGSERGGRVYMTAMAVLNLEVYYRYLPSMGSGPGVLTDDIEDKDKLGKDTGRDVLVAALTSEDMIKRRQASRELCSRGDVTVIPDILAAALKDRTSVRWLMFRDLTVFGDNPVVVKGLVAMLEEDETTQEAALTALRTITKETFKTVQECKEWWAKQPH